MGDFRRQPSTESPEREDPYITDLKFANEQNIRVAREFKARAEKAESQLANARKALGECRTAHCGYAITKDEQYPMVLASFWKEIQRIDGIARAALKDIPK